MSSTAAPPVRLKELSAVALLGLDRSPDERPPDAALNEVAAVCLRAKAGWRSAGTAEAVSPCPDDTRPLAGAQQQALLERVLGDAEAALVEEWCGLAVERGVRAAPASAPAVLEWWARQPRRSDVVFAALGNMGPWLAELNPAWRKPVVLAEVPADADARWETGTGAERAALLVAVRRADPARGLALVKTSWSADGADERRKFVEALASGASMADEPFLEAALDDRSKLVREAAAKALSAIEGSRLVTRAETIVKSCVRIEETKKGLLRRTVRTLVVEPPKEWNKTWERDGFEEKPSTKIGQRAWWLQQALALYGPRRLASTLAMDYAAMLEALRENEYGAEVVGGLREWVPARRDTEWLVALAGHELTNEKTPTMGVLQLLHGVPTETAERIVKVAAAARGLSTADVAGVCNAVAGPWSESFTRQVAGMVKNAPDKSTGQSWWTAEAVAAVSAKGSIAASASLEQAFDALDETTKSQPRMRASLDRLRLRQEMHKEFAR